MLKEEENAENLRRHNERHGYERQDSPIGKNGRTRSIALTAPLWSELTALRGIAGAEEPVFPSRSGKLLDRGRVRVIVRLAAKRAGVADAVSPHWLRHAHASHALDHGAPIHLVQATLGHSSVATTSSYLHARPGDSSARFLALERFSPESSRIHLPLLPTGAMNVTTAKYKRPKENHPLYGVGCLIFNSIDEAQYGALWKASAIQRVSISRLELWTNTETSPCRSSEVLIQRLGF